jgi:hypothetical protein
MREREGGSEAAGGQPAGARRMGRQLVVREHGWFSFPITEKAAPDGGSFYLVDFTVSNSPYYIQNTRFGV